MRFEDIFPRKRIVPSHALYYLPPYAGTIAAIPLFGGLHHRHEHRAA
jgi:hypothetical protein